MTSAQVFTTATEGLPEVARPCVIRLRDGDHLDLDIGPVRKGFDHAELRMLAYKGSIPGPILHVDQGSEITVHVTNSGDGETTVHWHGLRLENRCDGVPHAAQGAIPIGGLCTYAVQFPDAGFYWYHPHVREDFAQGMGLYGTIVVEPSDPSYWPAVDRYLTLTLDDLFVEDGNIASFSRSGVTVPAMGRSGRTMLINGQAKFSGEAALGEVLRLYVVNTASTRIFDFAVRGARMKLVGGDSGRYERERFVDEVLLAPSERAVIDVLFDSSRQVSLEHRTPDHVYDLGGFTVATRLGGRFNASFEELRIDPELNAEHQLIGHDLKRPPDKVLAFLSSKPLAYGDDTPSASGFVCPMYPEVTASGPAKCLHCGMSLVALTVSVSAATSLARPLHSGVTTSGPAKCPHCGMKLAPSDAMGPRLSQPTEGAARRGHELGNGLEWEDLMPEIDRAPDPGNMIWQLIDMETGAENGAIGWAFTVGDRIKIRLFNEIESDQAMNHTFHIHGAGRFLILARDEQPEQNMVWKDTVLLRAGETVDILLDVANPGLWMAHCHIAELPRAG